MAENVFTEVGDHGKLLLSTLASTNSKPCCDSHSHEHSDHKVPSIFDAVKSGFVAVTYCNVIGISLVSRYISDCRNTFVVQATVRMYPKQHSCR